MSKIKIITSLVLATSLSFGFLGNLNVFAGNQTNAVTTSTVSNFSGADTDFVSSSAILPNKSVLIGGKLSQAQTFGITPTVLAGATTGYVAMLNNTGQTLQKLIRIGSVVDEIETMPNGNIAVISDGALTIFDSTMTTIIWSKVLPASGRLGATGDDYGRKISVAKNNNIVSLNAKTSTVYSPTGTILSSITHGDTWVSDVEIDSDNNNVYVSGFVQSSSGPCSQIQLPFIKTYDDIGNYKFKSYGFSHDQSGRNAAGVLNNTSNNCADSRVVRLKVSPLDNSLFMIGRSDGGNSVFRWSSKTLWQNILTTSMDYSNSASGIGAGSVMYINKLRPSDGEVLIGQVHSARLSNATGNTMKGYDIDVDSAGEIYVSGASAYQIQDRPLQTVDGQPIGTYSGADGYLMQVSADMTKKRILTAFSGTNCPNEGNTVASDGKTIVTGGYFSQKSGTTCGGMMYNNPLQNGYKGGQDAYFAVLGDTALIPCTNGANNSPSCTVCTAPKTLVGGNCEYSAPQAVPTITISTETNEFVIGTPILIKGIVADPTNNPRKVELYSDKAGKINQYSPSNSGTYTYTWANGTGIPPQTLGEHKIRVSLTSGAGYGVTSNIITINIVNALTPVSSATSSQAVSSQAVSSTMVSTANSSITNSSLANSSAQAISSLAQNSQLPLDPNNINITPDFDSVQKAVSPYLFGSNVFDLTDSVLTDPNYTQSVKTLNPKMVRIHNAELMSDSATNSHGLLKKNPLNPAEMIWDRARIKLLTDQIKSQRATGFDPKYLINLNKLEDLGFDPFVDTAKYANLMADFVRIVNVEENAKIQYFEVTNEKDDDFQGGSSCNGGGVYCNKPFSELTRVFNASATAMKLVDSTIKTGGLSYQNPYANVDEFIDATLPTGNLDFLSYHIYDTAGNPVKTQEQIFAAPKTIVKDTANQLGQKLQVKSPNKKVELFLNEYNICWEYQCGFGGATNASNDYMKGQTSAIFDALGYIAGAEAGLDSLNTWNIKDTFYGKIASDNTIRPAGKLLAILNELKIKNLVSHQTTNDVNNEGDVKSATFTTESGQNVVMVINTTSQDKNLTILDTPNFKSASILDNDIQSGLQTQTFADNTTATLGSYSVSFFIYEQPLIVSSAMSSDIVSSLANSSDIASSQMMSSAMTSSDIVSSNTVSSMIASSLANSSDIASSQMMSSAQVSSANSSDIVSSTMTSSDIVSSNTVSSMVASSLVNSSNVVSSQTVSSAMTSSNVTSSMVASSLVNSSTQVSSTSFSAVNNSATNSAVNSSANNTNPSSTKVVVSSAVSSQSSSSSKIKTKNLATPNVSISVVNECAGLDLLQEYGTINQNKYIEFRTDCKKVEIRTVWNDLDISKKYKFVKYNPNNKIVADFGAKILVENGKVVTYHTITDGQNGDYNTVSGQIWDPYTLVQDQDDQVITKTDLVTPRTGGEINFWWLLILPLVAGIVTVAKKTKFSK